MRYRSLAFCAAIGAIFVAVSEAAIALPTCEQLATNPAYGLAGNPQVTGVTAVLLPAGVDPSPFPGFVPDSPYSAYCKVDLTFSGESGPSAGYLAGQSQQLKIRVGLPPNSVDLTSPTAAGAVPWNGRNRDLGGGGYAGTVGPTASSTNLGYVGTSTDTGHSAALGGSFALNPDATLNFGLIEDFASDGIHEQHVWGVKLAEAYYAMEPVRKYWMGCSTGGRQGHDQAQNFPQDFDGILAGANAFNWDRFITAELWPQVVMNQEVGAPIASAKLNAVTNAAIAACDLQDGIPDGIIQDPRACTYSATAFVCTANGGLSSDPNCLTPAEASAVNKIWDGPRDAKGNRAWYGLERGTPLSGPLGLAGPVPFSIATDHFKYWIEQNPSFDWHTVTEASFLDDMLTSIAKFNDVIGTDDNLKDFRKAGGKMITYHGLNDSLIFPRGTYHYYNSVLQGNYKETQKFYRFFPYPGNGHCGGGTGPQIDAEALFSTLVSWVEDGVEPDYVVASQTSPPRTRKICMYPNVLAYNGSGSTDDQANFQCEERNKDDLIDTLTIGKQFETSTKANTDSGPD
jgi:Tannase and feruloyl esterase